MCLGFFSYKYVSIRVFFIQVDKCLVNPRDSCVQSFFFCPLLRIKVITQQVIQHIGLLAPGMATLYIDGTNVVFFLILTEIISTCLNFESLIFLYAFWIFSSLVGEMKNFIG